jgi:hypothetical protein
VLSIDPEVRRALEPVVDLVAFLTGGWTVERTVRDGDEQGAFSGRASFRAGADIDADAGAGVDDGAGSAAGDSALVWDETGELRLGRYVGPARRRLLLVGAGDAWEVRFDDGRPFHPLDLRGGRCAAAHDCGEDRYEGEYRVLGRAAFETRWRVRGPTIDQEIVSRYRRE